MKKRIISLLLMIVMIVSIVPFGTISASAANQATSFTPRLSAPSKSGWYSDYNRNNCVAYAKARAAEILGYYPSFYGNGGQCYTNGSANYPKSYNVPKVGTETSMEPLWFW